MRRSTRLAVTLALASLTLLASTSAEAGGRLFRKRPRSVSETAVVQRPENQLAPSPMLGQFRPTPYITVRGGVSGDYSPLGNFGRENSFSVYGPLSAFRETSAPVNVVVRGYNGVSGVVEGTSFSNPNQPALSPVVYPTRASNYSAFRYQVTPPQWDKAIMWIDQN